MKSATVLLATLIASPAIAQTAQYQLVFEGLWSPTHASLRFPDSAHFTPLLGATHSAGIPLWEPGGLATPGVENVAETGGVEPLASEIAARIKVGTAGEQITSGGIFSFPAETETVFEIDALYPEVSLISMVAPSPDWFVGVSGLRLWDGDAWIESLSVDLMPYDAGTEQGDAFSLANPATVPQELIAMRGSPFVGQPAIGRLHFIRVPEAPHRMAAGSALLAVGLLARVPNRRTFGARRGSGRARGWQRA